MTDLTLHELKPADQKRLDELLRQEVSRMFGPTSYRIDSVPRKDRKLKIQGGILACLAPFRKLFHIT